MHFDISTNTILQVRSGSHAYGTSLPTSDVDIRGVAIAPSSTVLGYLYSFEQYIEEAKSGHPADRTIFDLRKFFKLTADCNPNMIEMLFVSDEDVLQSTIQGERLRENRNLFLSKRAKGRFAAYAMGQLARIKTHRSWLLNPPTHQPTREEYGISFQRKLRADQLGAISKLVESGQEIDQNVFQLVDAEKRYNTALKHWQQYNQWKANRNEARAALEARFGFDCYSEETEFLTETGWKTYEQIQDQEKLGTINPQTGEIEYQNFYERVKKPYSGEMFISETSQTSMMVTPNHRMLIAPGQRSNKNGFSTKLDPDVAWGFATFDSLLSGHKSHYHFRVSGKRSGGAAVPLDVLIVVGAYVSEGCVGKHRKDGSASVLRFSQKVGNRQQVWLEKLRSLRSDVKRFGPYRAQTKNELVWTLSDRELSKSIAEWCGEKSENKRLPFWAFSLSSSQAQILLAVMISGDGSQRRYSRIYHTSSARLAADTQALALIAGYPSVVWAL